MIKLNQLYTRLVEIGRSLLDWQNQVIDDKCVLDISIISCTLSISIIRLFHIIVVPQQNQLLLRDILSVAMSSITMLLSMLRYMLAGSIQNRNSFITFIDFLISFLLLSQIIAITEIAVQQRILLNQDLIESAYASVAIAKLLRQRLIKIVIFSAGLAFIAVRVPLSVFDRIQYCAVSVSLLLYLLLQNYSRENQYIKPQSCSQDDESSQRTIRSPRLSRQNFGEHFESNMYLEKVWHQISGIGLLVFNEKSELLHFNRGIVEQLGLQENPIRTDVAAKLSLLLPIRQTDTNFLKDVSHNIFKVRKDGHLKNTEIVQNYHYADKQFIVRMGMIFCDEKVYLWAYLQINSIQDQQHLEEGLSICVNNTLPVLRQPTLQMCFNLEGLDVGLEKCWMGIQVHATIQRFVAMVEEDAELRMVMEKVQINEQIELHNFVRWLSGLTDWYHQFYKTTHQVMFYIDEEEWWTTLQYLRFICMVVVLLLSDTCDCQIRLANRRITVFQNPMSCAGIYQDLKSELISQFDGKEYQKRSSPNLRLFKSRPPLTMREVQKQIPLGRIPPSEFFCQLLAEQLTFVLQDWTVYSLINNKEVDYLLSTICPSLIRVKEIPEDGERRVMVVCMVRELQLVGVKKRLMLGLCNSLHVGQRMSERVQYQTIPCMLEEMMLAFRRVLQREHMNE